MARSKTIVGICTLCALALGAFATQDAVASNGTTAFTCKEKAVKEGAGFSAAHCKPGDAVVSGASFEHAPVAENTKTEVQVTDLNTGGEHTGAILKSTIASSAIELVAKEVAGTGTMENRKEPASGVPVPGEHFVIAETSSKYTGVTENLLGCKVTGKPGGAGVLETKPLLTTTTGQGDRGKLTPKEGTVLVEFELTECAIGPITLKVVGSISCVPDGPTINCVHNTVTSEKTLRLQSAVGPVAGISVGTTFKGRANSSEPYKPLSTTTVETP